MSICSSVLIVFIKIVKILINLKMEGYELDRFVSPVDEGFICDFCNRVFRNPLLCLACMNIYCGECISKNLQAAD